MAEARHFCPECGSPEVKVRGTHTEIKLRGQLKGLECLCELCSWRGKVEDTVGAVVQGEFYTIEKISAILVGVTSKHAAGPLIQALELVGLLEENDQPGRDHVMRNISAAMIQAAFQSAGDWAVTRQRAIDDPSIKDEGVRPCPYCDDEYAYPYVHNCPAKQPDVVETDDAEPN